MLMIRLYRGINMVGTLLTEERPATVELPAGMRSLPPTARYPSDLPKSDTVDVYRFVRSLSIGEVYTIQEKAVSRLSPPPPKRKK